MVSRFRVPTAPGGLPFVGHTRRLSHDPLAYLRSLRGAGDLVRLRVGPRCVYLVTCPALTRRVLVDEARSFDKGAMFDELRLGMGNGLVISGGAFHRRQRRLAQPAFHPARIDGYTRAMTRRAGERTAAWQSGVTLDLTRELDELTLDILLDTVLGDSAGAVREDVLRWLSAKSGVMRRVLSPLSAWRARLLRPGPARPLPVTEDTLASLRALLAVEIHRGRLAPVGGGTEDMLSVLIAARDPDGVTGMTDAELTDELLTLFLAGTGTVSAALAWAFAEVSRHPAMERALADEALRVLGGPRPATVADLPELQYTERFLREVLRCHAVWLLMRRTLTAVELGGVTLPPGTDVYLSPDILHHDPGSFADPDRFDPDRWLAERREPGAQGARGAYLPFGAGNRRCAGDGYAWAEMALVLATTLARWRLVPGPGNRPRPRVGTVVRPERLRMIPEPR